MDDFFAPCAGRVLQQLIHLRMATHPNDKPFLEQIEARIIADAEKLSASTGFGQPERERLLEQAKKNIRDLMERVT